MPNAEWWSNIKNDPIKLLKYREMHNRYQKKWREEKRKDPEWNQRYLEQEKKKNEKKKQKYKEDIEFREKRKRRERDNWAKKREERKNGMTKTFMHTEIKIRMGKNGEICYSATDFERALEITPSLLSDKSKEEYDSVDNTYLEGDERFLTPKLITVTLAKMNHPLEEEVAKFLRVKSMTKERNPIINIKRAMEKGKEKEETVIGYPNKAQLEFLSEEAGREISREEGKIIIPVSELFPTVGNKFKDRIIFDHPLADKISEEISEEQSSKTIKEKYGADIYTKVKSYICNCNRPEYQKAEKLLLSGRTQKQVAEQTELNAPQVSLFSRGLELKNDKYIPVYESPAWKEPVLEKIKFHDKEYQRHFDKVYELKRLKTNWAENTPPEGYDYTVLKQISDFLGTPKVKRDLIISKLYKNESIGEIVEETGFNRSQVCQISNVLRKIDKGYTYYDTKEAIKQKEQMIESMQKELEEERKNYQNAIKKLELKNEEGNKMVQTQQETRQITEDRHILSVFLLEYLRYTPDQVERIKEVERIRCYKCKKRSAIFGSIVDGGGEKACPGCIHNPSYVDMCEEIEE